MRGPVALGIALSLALSAGCRQRKIPPGPVARGPDDAAAAAAPAPDRTSLLAELKREPDAVSDRDLTSRDARVRRAATRAIARTTRGAHVALLEMALSDEDPEVVAWAAYGLGSSCRAEGAPSADIVRALAVRGARPPEMGRARLSPTFAIARALGRCASDEAEKTLVAWLDDGDARTRAASFGLGDIAGRKKSLEEPTEVALLSAAAGSASTKPVGEALYPFGRLDRVLGAVQDRLLEVARGRLAQPGPSRVFAIRALARLPKGGDVDLERVLATATGYDTVERSEAARGLERFGSAGLFALARALGVLVPASDRISSTSLGTPLYGPLLAAVEVLAQNPAAVSTPGARAPLFALARLPSSDGAPVSLTRRVTRLRCAAATALVNAADDDPLLTACDGTKDGETGQLALLRVIGRRSVAGHRLTTFRKLAVSDHVRVREAVIAMLASHAEVEAGPDLARALSAHEPGMAATAAQLIAAHPERAYAQRAPARKGGTAEAPDVDPAIAAALAEALERAWPPDQIEALGSLAEAAGALRLQSAHGRLEALCKSANPTLREHAGRALSLMRGAKVACTDAPPRQVPEEANRLVSTPIVLELVTDAGSLRLKLDPVLAPVAVTRFVELAREGFYDGVAVHRVVPGFIVQLGDRAGDGYGGSGRSALPCETSPAPTEPLDVAVALSGKDTGSSQLFVSLGRQPQLDGDYALVGRAEGDWASVAEGDVIMHVGVLP
jgi:cyclophilin family peptidyl-prolyl cis-trans isomerase